MNQMMPLSPRCISRFRHSLFHRMLKGTMSTAENSSWLSEIAHMTTRPYVSDLSQPKFGMMAVNHGGVGSEDQVQYLLVLGANSATATLRSRVAIMIDGN